MPIYIKEENKIVSRLNRNHFVSRLVNYIEITQDEKAEKLDVKLYHQGAMPSVLAKLEIYSKQAKAPPDFKYEIKESALTFFYDNLYALQFLFKIDAISNDTFSLAVGCCYLETFQEQALQTLRR
jgi:hypothetical protein